MSSSILRALRKATRITNSPTLQSNLIGAIRNSNTGLTGVDNLFRVLPLEYVNGRLYSRSYPINYVENLVRQGNLRQLQRTLDLNVNISPTVERNFRSLLQTPEINISNLDTNITAARRTNPDLNFRNNTVSNINELPNTTRTKINNTFTLIKRGAGATAAAAGVFTAVYLGIEAFDSLNAATANRNGCFLSRVINNSLDTCKLSARSCLNSTSDIACSSQPSELPYNTATYLMNLAFTGSTNDDLLALIQAEDDGITEFNEETVNKIINNTNLFFIAEDYYVENPVVNFNPCVSAFDTIENGEIPECRCCVGAAASNSTEYVDTSDLADNFTLSCITNSTIIDTIVDIGVNLPNNIWQQIKNILGLNSGTFTTIITVFVVVLLAIVLFSIWGRVKPTKKVAPVAASASTVAAVT